MEDKKIIELYLERSDKAIPKTEEKYGQYASYIAHHILLDAAEANRCARESYELLWENIPPHRPHNLKAYLCKITRNHALQMQYPATNPELDLFSAELVIYDFLKSIDAEARKIFVARYWYMSSVSEIAMQFKISEDKVDKTVLSLRQKLDRILADKKIHLQSEEELLFAMTEIDDCYLAEAEPVQSAKMDNKKAVVAIACIVLLLVVALVWQKKPVEDTPITTLPTEDNESSGNHDTESAWEGVLIYMLNGEYLSETGFEAYMSSFPWNKDLEVATLPVYKNLSFVDIPGYQNSSNTLFLSEEDMLTMVMDIATKVDMRVSDIRVIKDTFSDELKNVVTGMAATTDIGSIEIKGDGRVYVDFFEGVELPEEYAMSGSASIEDANATVNYLLQKYADLFSTENLSPDCYEIYDRNGKRAIKYRAVERIAGVDGIDDYYFNQVEFEYHEQLGFTGIKYGDVRDASELLGDYPIISVEEAKELLVAGNYLTYEVNFTSYEPQISDFTSASYVELMYHIPGKNSYYYYSTYNKYYQPYYCFYVKMGDLEEYCRFYVPAIKGATETEIPVEESVTLEKFE